MVAKSTATKGWALVTGASSGIGAELARQLAKRGHDVVITARRGDRLETLAREIRARSGVDVLVIVCDLGELGGPGHLLAVLEEKRIVPTLLANNAGFGVHGIAIDQSLPRQLEMIDLNVRALTQLSLAIGAQMAVRGSGAILNVASTGAFQPAPHVAVYSATKSYVLSFSQALAWELASRGVRVLALCPGATKTEFFEAGQVHIQISGLLYMSAERCVQIALRALDRGRRVVVAGWLNAIGAWFARVLPQWLVVRVSARIMRPVPPPSLPGMDG
jgi:short-subunit dehydrogenase